MRSARRCHSGGATGSDELWGSLAQMVGDEVVHYSFRGHRTSVPRETLAVLTDAALGVADPYLNRANKTLQRVFPTEKRWLDNLLRRNYFQIREPVRSVYGIVPGLDSGGRIRGGTAWAFQMFLDQRAQSAGLLPAWAYDQSREAWLGWKNDGLGWRPIPTEWVPVPEGDWAGIGCRVEKLLNSGRAAAAALLGQTPDLRGQLRLI